jgi:hypothetical protein
MKKFIAIFAFMVFAAGMVSAQTNNATENNTEKKEHVVKEKTSCSNEKASCSKSEGGKSCCSKDQKKEEGKACCKDGKKEEGKACCKDGKKEGKSCSGEKKEESAQPKP